MGQGLAKPQKTTWGYHPVGPPPAGTGIRGIWDVTSLVGKEAKLVQEVEFYQFDIVGHASTHSTAFGTQLLERG